MITASRDGVLGVMASPMSPLDRLLELLGDDHVSDVFVNGVGPAHVDRSGRPELVEIGADDPSIVRDLAVRLAAMGGQRLDDARPWVDAALPGGARVHAVLPPIAVNGPYLSLRNHPRRTRDLSELCAVGTLDVDGASLVRAVVAARLPFLVTGGAGTGKTTLLGALLSECPFDERLLLIEDTPELSTRHPQVIRLATRDANIENVGAVDMRELVRQALRMRPDRVVIGECRGPEIMELLTALNTGHAGGAGTLHCNSPDDVLSRLAALALPHGVDEATLHAMVLSALNVIIHMRRNGAVRVVETIGVIDRAPRSTKPRIVPAWTRGNGLGRARDTLSELIAAADTGRS